MKWIGLVLGLVVLLPVAVWHVTVTWDYIVRAEAPEGMDPVNQFCLWSLCSMAFLLLAAFLYTVEE